MTAPVESVMDFVLEIHAQVCMGNRHKAAVLLQDRDAAIREQAVRETLAEINEALQGRRQKPGHSRLVYDKTKRTIIAAEAEETT